MSDEQIAAEIQSIVDSSDALRKKAVAYLYENGEVLDLGKWVTLKEYKERFGLKSINTLTNWIRRGVIPKDNSKNN